MGAKFADAKKDNPAGGLMGNAARLFKGQVHGHKERNPHGRALKAHFC